MKRIQEQLKVDEVNERLSSVFGFKIQTGRRSNYDKWALVEEKIDFNDLFTKRYIERKNIILIPKEELMRKYDEILPDLKESKVRTILRKNYHGNFGEKLEEKALKSIFKKRMELEKRNKERFRKLIEEGDMLDVQVNELFYHLTGSIIMDIKQFTLLDGIYSFRYEKILTNTSVRISKSFSNQKEYDDLLIEAIEKLKRIRQGRVEKISKKKTGELFTKRKPELELLLEDTKKLIKTIKQNEIIHDLNTVSKINDLISKKNKIEFLLLENNLEKTVLNRIKISAPVFIEAKQSYKMELKYEETLENKINEYINKELLYCESKEHFYITNEDGETIKIRVREG